MELYIHIPFCKKKCRYCSFTSFTGRESDYEAYIDLLLKEAEKRSVEADEPVRTVYIGGGTPSLLPSFLFRKLFDGLRDAFDLEKATEITTEANPGTVTREWLDTAVSSGVNRISFGMQAYQKSLLQLLGRIHQFSDVEKAVSMAKEAGINNISIDLIFGIPTQTHEDWSETLDAAISLYPVHISAYGLIPEEGTPLFTDLQKGLLFLPDVDEERKMYDTAVKKLMNNGYDQYEISNYAKKGFECLHNIGYWTQIPYIGLGVSAASMISVRYEKDGMSYRRITNPDTLEEYRRQTDRNRICESGELIRPQESRFETMMLGLRMNHGVDEQRFNMMHRVSVDECFGHKLRNLEANGFLIHENGCWRLSERGFDIQNSILVELMD